MREVKNCSVAVAGGAGFLGSHLAEHLVRDRRCKVVVIDSLHSGRATFVPAEASLEVHDITRPRSELEVLFLKHRVRFVFNYAAHPYIPLSFSDPFKVVNVNALGAMNVIEAARSVGCEAVLQVSSAELYGEYVTDGRLDGGNHIDESGEVAPHSTYGASKALVDFYVQARWREAQVPAIALRQFNCVGERETHPYVIPEIISQLYRSTDQTVRLGNNSTRDFLYAGDQAVMARELLEKGALGGVYNLGSERCVKVYDLAQMLADVAGFGRVKVVEDPARKRPWEIWHLCSGNAKIHSAVTARPQVTLEEALQRTVRWYVDNGKRWPWERF